MHNLPVTVFSPSLQSMCSAPRSSSPEPPSPPMLLSSLYFTTDYGFILNLNISPALDACINVTCDYHCQCKPLGPNYARCVSIDSCPSYQDPICSSNGTTFDNNCLFEQEMCQLQLNFTMYHLGSCEGMLALYLSVR